jgi:hypothetical protein
MSSEQIRKKFIQKFGKGKYEEFVVSLYDSFPLRDRLFFWQEKLLERLFKELAISVPSVKEIYFIFKYCPIHDLELKTDNVSIINGNNYSPNFTLQEEKSYFPLANINAPRDLDRFTYPETVNVLYCSDCRKEQIKKLNS